MTDTYLRSLGFAPIRPALRMSQASFSQQWHYLFDHEARDGARLFIEHPLGVVNCRLSAVATPLAQDVFAVVDLHDRAGLEIAIKAFYAAHGGMGPAATTLHASRPRRPE
ncbi:MAG: hypothetical protein ACRYG7_13965 [Janthinobacterium lividum]